MPEAVIVAAVRSPIGRAFKGSMTEIRPDDLLATIVEAALGEVADLDPHEVEDLMVGCGLPGGEQGFNLARVVAVLLGLDDVPGATVTRYCASSLQTTRMAFHAIRAGEGEVFVSAGVETISRFAVHGTSDPQDAQNPRFEAAQARTAEVTEHGADHWEDPREAGRLPDVYIAMGQTAENVALREGVTREEMDDYAFRSQMRYAKAAADGFWQREIIAVDLPDGSVMTGDESPRPDTTREAMAGLPPVFRPEGRVTAGNSCPLNDGAAAVVIMSDRRAAELGVEPLGRVVSTGVSALNPEIMGLGPVEASRSALERAGTTIDDMDVVELNEAFAAQVIPSARALGITDEQLNPHGGAIACGHPFGMTGARMTATLLNGLRHTGGTLGLETMCVGGGQGMAMVVERLS